MVKLTKDKFIEKAKSIHGDKYNYHESEYKTNKLKLKINCKIHGVFEQTPNLHLRGSGCPKCGEIKRVETKILTKYKFIKKSKVIHGDKYDYSLIKYINYDTRVKIICPIHGEFEQSPHSHFMGSGCQKCGGVYKPNSYEFIEKAKAIHGDKYDYSLVEYNKMFEKIQIICQKHGVFKQTPNAHINQKSGCQKCVGQNKTTEEFIKEAKQIHGDKYDYSLVEYNNSKIKIKIICSKHGVFKQAPNRHILGDGCPICRESKGEKMIREYLIKNNIIFLSQHKFFDCKNIRVLPFDFYLPEYNTCIEYDGEQHFKIKKHWGGIDALFGIQHRDKIKTKYCYDNNIKLLRIPYNTNIIDKLIYLYEL